MSDLVNLTQNGSAGSFDSYEVRLGDVISFFRDLPEARHFASELAKNSETTVEEDLGSWTMKPN
jgi:hypothetical protein